MTTSVGRWLPISFRRWVLRKTRWPRVGGVEWGELRRTSPISRVWGADRGLPVDRYYIEQFLAAHAGDIRGRVLEIGDNVYTLRFGQGVVRSDILFHVDQHPKATLVVDLTRRFDTPGPLHEAFDCIVCTQTLQQIYDVRTTLENLAHMLRKGGVLLLTVPGISQIDRPAMDDWGDYWRFTTLSIARLLHEVFPSTHVTVEADGNVVAAIAFLHGLSSEELSPPELARRDADYQVLLTVRAVKPEDGV